jgi:two-component system nitrogen regulation response regulator GlnG
MSSPIGAPFPCPFIIGHSPPLARALARTQRVAPTLMPVLVLGESGTGKELLARALHELGLRPAGAFVAINCGALPRELAESELFGHERGAFTGAAGTRTGCFEAASGGTLVLDEVGELPLDLQPKLLRVLETGRLRRVGGREEIAVDVRLVAMTNRDLRRESAMGRFRLDLYHRLAAVEITLPPLRARGEDVPALAVHFLKGSGRPPGPEPDPDSYLTPEAALLLAKHDWPGNIRELRNLVQRAALLHGLPLDRTAIEAELSEHVEPRNQEPGRAWEPATGLPRAAEPGAGYQLSRRAGPGFVSIDGKHWNDLQREIFHHALDRAGGSQRRAAAALGIARSTFCDWLKRLNAGSAPCQPV